MLSLLKFLMVERTLFLNEIVKMTCIKECARTTIKEKETCVSASVAFKKGDV